MFFAVEIEFVVQFQTTDQREVVTLRIKEEVVEQVRSCFQRRRITGTQSAINLDHRFALAQGFVGNQACRGIAVPVVNGSKKSRGMQLD